VLKNRRDLIGAHALAGETNADTPHAVVPPSLEFWCVDGFERCRRHPKTEDLG
jgi:hypothetical protein